MLTVSVEEEKEEEELMVPNQKTLWSNLSSIEADLPSHTCDKTEAPFHPGPSVDVGRNVARWYATTHVSTSTMNKSGILCCIHDFKIKYLDEAHNKNK